MINSIEEMSLQFIKKLQNNYFEERNLQWVLEKLDKDIVWFGTGKKEFCCGYSSVLDMLTAEKASFKGSFTILECDYHTKVLSDKSCMVTGFLRMQENKTVSVLDLRLSAVVLWKDTQLKLLQLHLSQPSTEQPDNEFFPTVLPKQSFNLLRKLVDEQSYELRKKNEDLKALTSNIPGGVFRYAFREDLPMLQLSNGFLTLFGYTRKDIKEIFNNKFLNMVYEPDRSSVLESFHNFATPNTTKSLEYRVICKDKALMWVLEKGQLVEEENGEKSFYSILININETKKAQEELRLSVERHKIILDQTTDIIFEWDIKKDTVLFSSNWEKKFGYPPITKQIRQEIPFYCHLHKEDIAKFHRICSEILSGKEYIEEEIRIIKKDSMYLWCKIRASAQYDENGNIFKAVGVIIDIDNEKRIAQQLLEKAERDTLTGLYNKGTCQSLCEKILREESNSNHTLMIIDIDNFKTINDTFGHLCGDAILIDISNAMKTLFRETDIAGRIGGDEFIILLKDTGNKEIISNKADKILKAICQICQNQNINGHISCSIGISIFPQDGNDFHILFKNADYALYQAKNGGKNQYAFFQPHPYGILENSILPNNQHSTGTMIDSKIEQQTGYEVLSRYVFQALYQTRNIEVAIPIIFKLIGEQFHLSRVYLLEYIAEKNQFCNTFEWYSEDIPSEKNNLQDIDFKLIEDLSSKFNERNIFYCKDIAILPQHIYEFLNKQHIKSVLLCALKENGIIKGIVGFDDCIDKRFWTRNQIDILTLISETISIFLLKERSQIQSSNTANQLKTILDHQSFWIYVVDLETYEIIYSNKQTLNSDTKHYCYEIFFGENFPCQQCPAKKVTINNKCAMNLYSPILKKHFLAEATLIPWTNNKQACLLCCQETLSDYP